MLRFTARAMACPASTGIRARDDDARSDTVVELWREYGKGTSEPRFFFGQVAPNRWTFDIYQITGVVWLSAQGLLGACSWVVWCLLRACSRPTQNIIKK